MSFIKSKFKKAQINDAKTENNSSALNLNNETPKTVTFASHRYSIFEQQNPEIGHFDVTFLFGTKELYAHSFVLWTASEVFETMLFGAWAKQEPIPITYHSYINFKEFLTFLYIEKCDINIDNVMAFVDLAELYNIPSLKEKCDKFLIASTPTAENVFKVWDTLKIYDLKNTLENLMEFIALNASTLLISRSFLEVEKEKVIEIVKMDRLIVKEEDLFDAIYKWGEYQLQKQENPSPIKEILADILPYIRFPTMNIEFLHNFVVPRGSLISTNFDEISQILKDADRFQRKILVQPLSNFPHRKRQNFNLKFVDVDGNKAFAYFENINLIQEYLDEIDSKKKKGIVSKRLLHHKTTNDAKSCYNGDFKECTWEIVIPKQSTENVLFDINLCKMYLCRNSEGKFAIKDFSTPYSQYALEEKYRKQLNLAYNFFEYDLIGQVFLEDKNFKICDGCTVDIID